MIKEPDKRITPTSWKKELEKLKPDFKATQKPYSQVVWKLAAIEVLNHSKLVIALLNFLDKRNSKRK